MLGRQNGVTFLRAAFEELGGRRRVRDRLLFRRAAQSDAILELIYLNFESDIEASIDSDGPDLPSGVSAAFGDGTILEKFGNFFKWIIENQDAVANFLKTLISIFAGAAVI